MRQHLINLDYLAEAACLLLGDQGALRLAVVYATLVEKIAKREYERGFEDGDDAATMQVEDENIHYYDIYHGRFHRPGEE